MSTLVLLGEQPSALELAALFTRLGASNAAALSSAARDGKLSALLAGVTAQSSFLAQQSDEDYTAALTLSFAVLSQLSVAGEAAAATTALAALLSAESAQRAQLKIRTLTNLINVVGGCNTVSAAQRFAVLMQMMEFALAATTAGSSSPAALVLQPLSSLQSQISAWKLSASDATALLLVSYKLSLKVGPNGVASKSAALKSKGDEFAAPAAAATFYNLGAQPTVQQEYLYAMLKSLDAAAPATLKEKQYQDLALQAVLASAANGLASTLHILDPVNVYQLAAVQALSASNNAQAAAAFQLLRILVDADLPAWVSFEKAAGAALLKDNAATLDAATLLRKIRTLALCSLAVASQSASAGDNVLSYAQIQQKLQLAAKDSEAVEAAVIDAVMAGRIDAKMDQEAETIIVKSVPARGESGATVTLLFCLVRFFPLADSVRSRCRVLLCVQARDWRCVSRSVFRCQQQGRMVCTGRSPVRVAPEHSHGAHHTLGRTTTTDDAGGTGRWRGVKQMRSTHLHLVPVLSLCSMLSLSSRSCLFSLFSRIACSSSRRSSRALGGRPASRPPPPALFICFSGVAGKQNKPSRGKMRTHRNRTF